MRKEPLFIRFANGDLNARSVVESFIENSDHSKSLAIAKDALDGLLPDLSYFARDFRNALEDLIDNGINKQFVSYLNCYMSPSLSEILEGEGRNNAGEKRWVFLKSEDAPWIEGLVCYNLTLYIKAFGYKELKRCPVCKKFFTNKGKYAKYCSDACKGK